MGFVLLLTVWEVLGRTFHLRPDVLPTPSRIMLEAWRDYAALVENAAASGIVLVRGIGAALAFALALAVFCASYGGYCRVMQRVMTLAQMVPFIAAVPILVVWFGYGKAPEVLVVFLIAFPVLGRGALEGLRAIPPEISDFGRTMRASRLDLLLKVQLPCIAPPMLRSLKVALTMAVAAAIAAEFALAEAGLGALMMGAVLNMNTPLLLAAFFCATALAAVPIGLIGIAARMPALHYLLAAETYEA